MSQEYPVGSNVWAKLKGYPWWPARIEEEKTLPQIVLDKKPNRPNPIWPVFFYGSEDYGWFGRDCLKDFNTHLHELSTNTKKGALFCKALKQATQPSKLGASINGSEEESESETKTSTKAGKRGKAKASTKPEPRKRANTRSTPTKAKKQAVEKESTEDIAEQEEIGTSNDTQPEADQDQLLKSMVHIRHNLQRAALKEKMKDSDSIEHYLDEVEKFPLNAAIIQESKIGKLLRHLVRNSPENKQQERIIERSHMLIKKFKGIINEQPEGSSHGDNSHINGTEDKDETSSKDKTQAEPKSEDNHTDNNGTTDDHRKSPHPSEDISSPTAPESKQNEVNQPNTTTEESAVKEAKPEPVPEKEKEVESAPKEPKKELESQPEPESKSNPEPKSQPESKDSSHAVTNGTVNTVEPTQDSAMEIDESKPSLKHKVEEDPTEEESRPLSPSKKPKTEDASDSILSPKESESNKISETKIDSAAGVNDKEDSKDQSTIENGAAETITNSINQQPKEETPQTATSA